MARDILASGMAWCEMAGFRIVGHRHDEIIAVAIAWLMEITGLQNPNSTTQLKMWLAEQDHPMKPIAAPLVALALSAEMPIDSPRTLWRWSGSCPPLFLVSGPAHQRRRGRGGLLSQG